MAVKLPKLPQLLDRKIYKTGQTRGADDDVIYQNRVSRNSTVLIPYAFWGSMFLDIGFEKGFIVLISPNVYFGESEFDKKLASQGLKLGQNLLIFYETRQQWEQFNPEEKGLSFATSRLALLGGEYVARVAATTALENGQRINRGFTETSNKGAGIRVFEYAHMQTILDCRAQLEAIFWLCSDSINAVLTAGMRNEDAITRREAVLEDCKARGLLDVERLVDSRIINQEGHTTCPLCLEELSGVGFMNRMTQAEGREVFDLTVTEVNLFHIEELRISTLNHQPYNLGWGHHHCNVVAKDSGITPTIRWMQEVIQRNVDGGYLD